MSTTAIPIDKAELLSVLLEALLYGFSLLMCGGTIWTLVFKRSAHRVNHKMLTVACSLLLLSTVHIVIDFIRIMEGLILYRDSYPGGPIGYFSDLSQWTFVAKNYVFTAQTLMGDAVVLYRCYLVWQSKVVMILPVLLWCTVATTGIVTTYTASKMTQDSDILYDMTITQWIASFFSSALAANLLTTLLLASRIWYVDRMATRLCRIRKSPMRPILHIIIDSGVIYSLTLVVGLICFVNRSNGQFVILDMITPIISITFYMVIIRVGLTTRANHTPNICTFKEDGVGTEQRQGENFRITTLTESIVDDC